MYVRVKDGKVINLGDKSKEPVEVMFNRKYILNRDHVVFAKQTDGSIVVERFRGLVKLYRYTFVAEGDFMVAKLFVDKYKPVHPITRDAHAYLESKFHDRYYIEEDEEMHRAISITLSTWIDRTFTYKYTVKVNPNLVDYRDLNRMKSYLDSLDRETLYKIHQELGGKSVYISSSFLQTVRHMIKRDAV